MCPASALLTPQLNQNYKNQCRQPAPNDQNYLDSDLADGRNVFGYIRIFIEEPVAIAKDVEAPKEIDNKEDRSRYA